MSPSCSVLPRVFFVFSTESSTAVSLFHFPESLVTHTSQTLVMAENGAEKRKADEMTADSVEVPLAELQELAEKGGEPKEPDHARTYIHTYIHSS